MWRCINHYHNSSQNEPFSLLYSSIRLDALGGGLVGGADKGGCSCPPPPHLDHRSSTVYAHSTCFKLSEHEVVSTIIMMQAILSCLPCYSISYTRLQGLVWTVQGILIRPHPPGYQSLYFCSVHLFQTLWMWRCINFNHNSSQIELFLCYTVSYAWSSC